MTSNHMQVHYTIRPPENLTLATHTHTHTHTHALCTRRLGYIHPHILLNPHGVALTVPWLGGVGQLKVEDAK